MSGNAYIKEKNRNKKSPSVVWREKQPKALVTAVASYLESVEVRKYSWKSVRNYGYELDRFLLFLGKQGIRRMQDVTLEDLERYRLDLVKSDFQPPTVTGYLSTVRNLFRYLESQQHIFVNPADKLIISRPPPVLPRVPTVRDIEKLLSMPDVTQPRGLRDRALLELAYSTGTRLAETAAVTIFDIDLQNSHVRVLGKGRKERVLPLGKYAVHWIDRYLHIARPKLVKDNLDISELWINNKGKALCSQGIITLIRRYSRMAELDPPVTCHAIRRACVTHMLRNGAHPVKLQMMLGHTTVKNLSQYLRLTITELQKIHRQTNPGR